MPSFSSTYKILQLTEDLAEDALVATFVNSTIKRYAQVDHCPARSMADNPQPHHPVLIPNFNKSSKFILQHDSVLQYLYDQERHLKTVTNRTNDETLYLHQVEAVLKVHKYFNSDPNIRAAVNPNSSNVALIVLPTGCGKSGVAVLASYILRASRALVITPSFIISKQIDDDYKNFLVGREVISVEHQYLFVPQKMLITKSSQIITEPGQLQHQLRLEVQQADLLITNAHKISDASTVKVDHIPQDCFDLVIVDEAHHYPAKTWRQLVDHFPSARKIFLTATPEHRGQPIMEEPPCYRLTLDDAVKDGIIRRVLFEQIEDGGTEEEKFKVGG